MFRHALILLFFAKTATIHAQCASWEAFPKGVEEAKKMHTLYRDAVKANNHAEAFVLWRPLFDHVKSPKEAPRRHFEDGVAIYRKLLDKETDANKRAAYQLGLVEVYEEMAKCFPLDESKLAYQAYYYQSYGIPAEKLDQSYAALYKMDIEKIPYFIHEGAVVYFLGKLKSQPESKEQVALAVNKIVGVCLTKKDSIHKDTYWPVFDRIKKSLDGPDTLIMGCEWFEMKYQPLFEKNKEEINKLRSIAATLRKRGCGDSCEMVANINRMEQEWLARETERRRKEQEEMTPEARIEMLKSRLASETDPNVQADINFYLADAHFRKGQFSTARQYAYAAAEKRSGWGKPYLLIGSMYASSGKQCDPSGVGRGFDAQIVTWPAIDMWTKAKTVDPSCAAEANDKIKEYSQYMPTTEDCHLRSLKPGQTFQVGCWIQESTKVRTAK